MTPRLTASARYRLDILSRGSRVYGAQDYQIRALARRGLVEPLPGQAEDGPRRWRISEAGRAVLQGYTQTRRAGQHREGDAP